MVANKKTTIYDVAKVAGVSTATVTRVMSGSEKVSKITREKVQNVIAELNYTPSTIAKSLEQGQSRTIGVILPDITNPYYAELFTAAEQEAKRNGYSVCVYQLQDQELVAEKMVKELIECRFYGAFFVGGIGELHSPELIDALQQLSAYMPIVALCPPKNNFNCICLYNDLENCVAKAVYHLHSLGHKRIAFLGGSVQVNGAGARGEGFLRALHELGLEENPAYYHEDAYTCENGERTIMRLLSGIEREQWPTALVAFNDLVALGAIKQLKKLGLSIPEDMAIIGCDNQFFAAYTDPPLTTMDLHPTEHATSAIQELLRARERYTKPFHVCREATLVIRESCGAKLGFRKLQMVKIIRTLRLAGCVSINVCH